MKIGNSISTSTYINAYLKNSGYSFAGSGKSRMGNTLTNMLKTSSIKKTSYYQSLYDGFGKTNNSNKNTLFPSSSVSGFKADEKTLAESAKGLRASAVSLSDADLYKKNENGEYDYDKICQAVNSFAEDYNKTIKAFQNSECIPALKQGVAMTETTTGYKRALGKIGITVNSDNTLSVNESALKNADITLLKSMTTGQYSFTSKVAERAQIINESAKGASGVLMYDQNGACSNYSSAIAALLSLYV